MKLSKLLKEIEVRKIIGNTEFEVTDIFYDSRKVKAGSLFVCVKGLKFDGHRFINDALKRGAKGLVVCEESYLNNQIDDLAQILVNDTRKTLAELSWSLYGKIWEKADVIGITGTNGKTSTALLIDSILNLSGKKTGLIGTIYYKVNGEKIEAARTTPESSDLARLFQQMITSNTEYVVMEITSHALTLDRVFGIKLMRVILTNLTQDHLDFHQTFDSYRKAKFGIFSMLKKENVKNKFSEASL